MQATEYLEGLVADWLSGSAFPAVPGQLRLALSEANPGDDGAGFDEVTGGSYARQNITLTAPTTNEANGAVSSNTASIVFSGLPTTTATHVAIFDNAGTNMLLYGSLSAIRSVTAGDSISFAANVISVAFKGKYSKYLGEAIMNWLRGTSMPAAPASIKFELSTVDPLRDATGFTPPSGGAGYVAQTFEFDAPQFVNGTGTSIANVDPIIFGPATASWGVVSHAAVYSVGGDMLLYGPLAVPKTVGNGEGMGFSAGSLSLLIR